MRDHRRVHAKKAERLRTRGASRARAAANIFHELGRLCAPSTARLHPNHDQAAPVYLEQIPAKLPHQQLPQPGHEQPNEPLPADAVRQFGRVAEQSLLTRLVNIQRGTFFSGCFIFPGRDERI